MLLCVEGSEICYVSVVRYLLAGLLATALFAEVPLGRDLSAGAVTIRMERYSTAKATEAIKRGLNLTDADIYAKSPIRGEGVLLTVRSSEPGLKELIVEVTVSRNAATSTVIANCSVGLYLNTFGPQCFIQTGPFDRVESVSGYPVVIGRSPVRF